MAGKHYDLVDLTKKYKGSLYEFFLDFASWKAFKTKHPLAWERVPFKPESRELVPQERGIYVFTTLIDDPLFPLHGYLLYVGITGAGDSNSNLRIRYSQYERNQANEDGRPAIYYMLDEWRDDLCFNFVPLPDLSVDLDALETDFINSVMPPLNQRDFSATKAAVRRSAF